ncbi:hypothetical protein EV421DRAFT_1742096 [Armillaria borealis]|uniref:Uncharacterized protein n=1 Tax=Armillaria borealis TaxID=47425 RepID=A0AA39IZI0_9AGAR|nr:hypothetical protein EV421DRAFT_1742096 [Armillaria borealis]
MTEQKQKWFKHRMLLRQSQPGWLPTWLGRFRFPDGPYAERDNSFQGMYGPGFTYDCTNNIMYADMEAVDAAKAFMHQADYPLPHRMNARPNPRGFLMTVHEMDPRLGNLADNLPPPVYIPLERAYHLSGGGNTVGGAGLPIPVDGTIDDWCQYVAHHYRPGGLNPPTGLMMDLSYREMIDSAYPWAMIWVDQHQSIHFQDWYHHLEDSRLQRLEQFGVPQIIPELQGWWTPDIGNTHRIRAMIYNERYLLRGESSVFTYINSFPPTTPHSPYQSEANTEIDTIQEDVPMTPMVDTAGNNTLDIRAKAMPNATAQDPMIATTLVESSANPHDIPLPTETDKEMSKILVPIAEVEVIAQVKFPDTMPTIKSQT